MKHVRHKVYWRRDLFLLIVVLLMAGVISHSLPQVALAQTEVPLEGQSAIIEKSLRQSIPSKLVPQDPSKSKVSVLNQNKIHASDFSALIAPSVNNKGVVVAKLGTVRLASEQATTVDFVGNGLIVFTVNKPLEGQVMDKGGNLINNRISNTSSIQANGGQVILSTRNASRIIRNVINMEGMIEAKMAIKKDGCVFLENETQIRSQKYLDGMPCF